MKCPRCTDESQSVGVEPGTYGTRRRQYQCGRGHRFTTLEAYEPQDSSVERTGLMKALRAIQTRFTPQRSTTCR